MSDWIETGRKMVDLMLMHPGSQTEFFVLLGAGCLALVLAYGKISSAVDLPNSGLFYGLLVGAVGLALTLAVLTAARLYLVPRLDAGLRSWALFGSAVLVMLAVLVPLLQAVLKGSYLSHLLAWGISFLAGGALVYVLSVGFDVVSSGSEKADRVSGRQQYLEEMMRE